jgi:hypothetical protein
LLDFFDNGETKMFVYSPLISDHGRGIERTP